MGCYLIVHLVHMAAFIQLTILQMVDRLHVLRQGYSQGQRRGENGTRFVIVSTSPQ